MSLRNRKTGVSGEWWEVRLEAGAESWRLCSLFIQWEATECFLSGEQNSVKWSPWL